jgi:hypothetical protein
VKNFEGRGERSLEWIPTWNIQFYGLPSMQLNQFGALARIELLFANLATSRI